MRRRKFLGALIAAAFGLMSPPVWSQEVAGVIESASGWVRVTHRGQSRPAEAGMQLISGDRVVTGPGSYAGIKLRDETVLTMGPDGLLRINRFWFNPDTNVGKMILTVITGTMRVVTGLIGRHTPTAVEIRTMAGTIGIRGTEFIVEAGETN